MNLSNVDLLSLQTKQMQKDQTIRAVSAALTPQIRQAAGEIAKCLLLSRIDELPEGILDQLAWELHIDWYDSTVSMDVKRNLVRNSDKVHMYLGTPYAVEQVVQDYFGDGYVEEWFEYGGDPYMFRVVTTNPAVTADLANQFTKAITAVKRGSAFLEQIIIALSAEMNLYLAGVVHTGDLITVEQVV